MIFDDFEAPENDFSRIFRGSSEIVDWGFFYDFWEISGDPPEFIKILFFDSFRSIGDFIESAAPSADKQNICSHASWVRGFRLGFKHEQVQHESHKHDTALVLLLLHNGNSTWTNSTSDAFLYDFWIFRKSENPGNRNIQKSGFSGFPEFQESDFRKLGSSGIRESGFSDFRTSGSP